MYNYIGCAERCNATKFLEDIQMKKILAIVLALTVVLVCFAACGNKTKTDATPTDAEETTAGTATVDMAITDIIPKLYEANPVEFPADTAGMAIDVADADALAAYTGLTDASLVEEAYFSESMIGAQAYSLVIARVADGADVEAVKKAMFEGINTRKWVCVEADQLTVASTGDLVILCMVGSELIVDFDTTMVNSFADVAGALTGETFTK